MTDEGLGFGGFLLGLGAGWYLFQYIDFGFEAISYLFILMGLGMIFSGLLTRNGRQHPISKVFGGVIGGLFLAAFFTQGFGLVFNIADSFTDISDGQYRATESFTINTDLTGDALEFHIDSVNGEVNAYTWSGDTVKWEIEVKSKGGSNSEAEALLAAFDYDLTSELSGSTQTISMSFPLTNREWNDYAVFIDFYIPADTESSYYLLTTNGRIQLHDLTCDIVDLATTNGGITLDNIKAISIQAGTTNGLIQGTIDTPTSKLSTTNGAIEITLTETTGIHDIQTTNGLIDINTPTGSTIGYKVNIDTSIGALDVNLPNMDYDVDTTRTKIGETIDYTSKTIKIEINAETTIGGIEIN